MRSPALSFFIITEVEPTGSPHPDVARTFLDLGRKEGKRVPEGILITERPTQAEIAGLVGTSRETVSRAMSELQRRGYIRQQGRGLLLLGGEELEEEVLG